MTSLPFSRTEHDMAFEHTEHFAPEEEMIRLAEYAERMRVQREQAAALEAAPRHESA